MERMEAGVKKDMATKWVEALRSGEYEQGINALKNGNKYCCLGVLCEISGISRFISGYYLGESTCLSSPVMLECGIRHPLGVPCDGADVHIHINGVRYDSLMSANDNGAPFSEIADWIETNYEKL